MKRQIAAAPLITCDPFFSIWSTYDELFGGKTTHWSGEDATLHGYFTVNGKLYRFMGDGDEAVPEQTGLSFKPHFTDYTFSVEDGTLKVSFFTPSLIDDLTTVTLPVSFISYEYSGSGEFSFGISLGSGLLGGSDCRQSSGAGYACIYSCLPHLSESGDGVTAKWGGLYIAHENAVCANGRVTAVSHKTSGFMALAYDDIKAARYLGRELDDYYRVKYPDFITMLNDTVNRFGELSRRAAAFDLDFAKKASVHGNDCLLVASLAFRQSIGAHKLALCDGEAFFISKECYSNGCAATLDVTYPSIPMYLLYNPELVRAMLRPLFGFARSDMWRFSFAPHDCGQFPLLDKQVYGLIAGGGYDITLQMPVEECGNAIICACAASFADGNDSFVRENLSLLEKWAEYLIQRGYCPEDQLCTDDFAGHLDRNCNLSVKTITALGCLGKLTGDSLYTAAAKKMAAGWVRECASENGSPLTFGGGGWSLKYNMIWDKIYTLGLFPEYVYENELKCYRSHAAPFGIPLDSRAAYTKLDWLAWTTVFGDEEYTREVFASMTAMMRSTPDRVPLTDWYDTANARRSGFSNRTVVGGVLVGMLYDAERSKK